MSVASLSDRILNNLLSSNGRLKGAEAVRDLSYGCGFIASASTSADGEKFSTTL